MPSSKTKLRTKGSTKGAVYESPTSRPAKEVRAKRTVETKQAFEHISASRLLELRKEQGILIKQLKEVKQENEHLTSRHQKHLKELELDRIEKDALLEECFELNNGGGKRRRRRKTPPVQKGESSLMPYELDSIKKLGSLSGRLIRELISLKNLKEQWLAKYVDEQHQIKVLNELLEISCVSRRAGQNGRAFLKVRVDELKTKASRSSEKLHCLKERYNQSVETGWAMAVHKYEKEVKQLTVERSKLQKEFLEKEAKLKDVQAKEILLEIEITAKKSKIEKQTEANNNAIFSSPEFTELMDQRDTLLTRIEKSIEIMEDTKVAHDEVVVKIGELHLNLLKNQKRVEELTSKLSELTYVTEEEKIKTINTSSVMEYVSQELNSKNGILLMLESQLEELESEREMLQGNLAYCYEQNESLSKENDEKTKRISQLQEEYFYFKE